MAEWIYHTDESEFKRVKHDLCIYFYKHKKAPSKDVIPTSGDLFTFMLPDDVAVYVISKVEAVPEGRYGAYCCFLKERLQSEYYGPGVSQ